MLAPPVLLRARVRLAVDQRRWLPLRPPQPQRTPAARSAAGAQQRRAASRVGYRVVVEQLRTTEWLQRSRRSSASAAPPQYATLCRAPRSRRCRRGRPRVPDQVRRRGAGAEAL